jgi:hypothetical protein
LIGLRRDMAELFYEFKVGDKKTTDAHAAEAEIAAQDRHETNARLDHLEEQEPRRPPRK